MGLVSPPAEGHTDLADQVEGQNCGQTVIEPLAGMRRRRGPLGSNQTPADGYPPAMQTHHPVQGLSSSEVTARRAAGKGATPPRPTGRTYAQIVREDGFPLVNVVLYLLCLALLLLGQVSEALVASAAVLFNAVTSTVQEVRAKRTLDRIALLTRPRATVLRDGQEQLVDPGELVQEDVLLLRPGDQIVVDGPVIGEGSIDVDESLLTGESDAVTKQAGDRLYSGCPGYFTNQTIKERIGEGNQRWWACFFLPARRSSDTHPGP